LAISVLIDFFRPPWAVRRKLAVSLAAVNIIGTVVFASLSYQAARSSALTEIDDILCAAADGLQQIVPPLVVNFAEAETRPEPQYTEAYEKAHQAIESYVEAARIEYLYAIGARSDGTSFELISNLSPEQQATRADPMKDVLLKPYELSPIMTESVASGERRIDVAQDEYGYFRSCIIPVKTANGASVIYGADLEISAVNARLLNELITNVSVGFFVLVGTLIVIRILSNTLAKDINSYNIAGTTLKY